MKHAKKLLVLLAMSLFAGCNSDRETFIISQKERDLLDQMSEGGVLQDWYVTKVNGHLVLLYPHPTKSK